MPGPDDPGPNDRGSGDEVREGLRERKKRLTRELISNTATEMFLIRGFDAVRVSEVADACGVSEKTIYNYFPTKESLLLDREADMAEAIRAALGPDAPARSPVDAMLDVLAQDLESLRAAWSQTDTGRGPVALPMFRQFTALIDSTPSLRAAQHDMMDRLVGVAAEAMAARAGVSPDDPEPKVAAYAMLGLWQVQFQALRRHAADSDDVDLVIEQTTDEVHRAAKLVNAGLWAFAVMVQGAGSREQLKAAAEAAQRAGKQVASALRQARGLWRDFQHQHPGADRASWKDDPELRRRWQEETRRLRREHAEQWRKVAHEHREEMRRARERRPD
ncbi:MAG TPA: TetR family transcriptional regulator [Mycobacteriales bacterium]|nr:TetR family transcriptional regulator [Mycobacteriales bacterium]